MTQAKDPKKPGGSRDISELKARLGLKKPGAAAPGGKPNGGGGGASVVPPPGLNLPPPPGAKPPGPAIPNAADDPFGAMNAMASYQATQRAPEIVIVNDGKPVESVSTGEKLGKYGKLAAMIIAPLIVGLIIGQIGKGNAVYNSGINGAKLIKADVERVSKSISGVKKVFDENPNFKTRDTKDAAEITRKLEEVMPQIGDDAVGELAANRLKVLKARQSTLSGELGQKVNLLYSQIAVLETMIKTHLVSAKNEEAAIASQKDALAALTNKDGTLLKDQGFLYKIGIVLQNKEPEEGKKPQGEKVRIVEIGQPLCGDTLAAATAAADGTCGDKPLAGFKYRYKAGDETQWLSAKLHIPESLDPGAEFPLDEIILPQQEVGVADIVKGHDISLAEVAYFDRLKRLQVMVEETVTQAEAVLNEVTKRANESPRFTFFL